MTIEALLIAILATYRLTYMLNSEAGPADIFGRLRTRVGVRYDEFSNPVATNWLAEGILCYFCLSVWISFAVAALVLVLWLLGRMDLATLVLLPFALSGGAAFLKRWGG